MKRRGYDCTRCTSLATFTGGFIHFLRFTSDKAGDYAPPRSRTFSAKNLTACKVKFRKVSLSTTWLEFIIHIWRTRLLLSFCAIFTGDDLTGMLSTLVESKREVAIAHAFLDVASLSCFRWEMEFANGEYERYYTRSLINYILEL